MVVRTTRINEGHTLSLIHILFVSHDLALVAQLAHHITVMYAGQVVEMAPTSLLLANPTHEYTRGLLGSVLSTEVRAKRLYQIPGSVPVSYTHLIIGAVIFSVFFIHRSIISNVYFNKSAEIWIRNTNERLPVFV